MASIKPEHLLDSHDYYSFLKNRKKTSRARESEETDNEGTPVIYHRFIKFVQNYEFKAELVPCRIYLQQSFLS